MRNKFAGNCFVCLKHVPIGKGYFQRMNGGWATRCMKCVGKGNIPDPKPTPSVTPMRSAPGYLIAEMAVMAGKGE